MATKKTSTKKATSKTLAAKTSTTTSPVETKTSTKSPSRMPARNLIIIAIIVLIVGAILIFKNQLVVATVNGEPITRLQLIRELEKKDGKTVLASIVTESLIKQEAEKRNIQISDAAVKNEVTKIEKSVTGQGQNLDLLLTQQNMTRADLTDQMKMQLMLQKMVEQPKVTEAEIDKYLEDNKESIQEGTDMTTLRPQVKTELEKQKLNEKIQTFIADLQKKAKIDYLKNY